MTWKVVRVLEGRCIFIIIIIIIIIIMKITNRNSKEFPPKLSIQGEV